MIEFGSFIQYNTWWWISVLTIFGITLCSALVFIFRGLVYNYYKSKNFKNAEKWDPAYKIYYKDGMKCWRARLSSHILYGEYGYNNDLLEVLSVVGWAIKFMAVITCLFLIIINNNIKADYKDAKNYYNNYETVIQNLENVDHPTKSYIEKCESFNNDIKNNEFFTDEFKADLNHYVNTELLWARFCDNVHSKRELDTILN